MIRLSLLENRNVPKAPRSRQQACNGYYCRNYSDPKHDTVPKPSSTLRAAPWLKRGGSRALDAGGTDDLGLPPTRPFQISKRLALIYHGQKGFDLENVEKTFDHTYYILILSVLSFKRQRKGAPVMSDTSHRKLDGLKLSRGLSLSTILKTLLLPWDHMNLGTHNGSVLELNGLGFVTVLTTHLGKNL